MSHLQLRPDIVLTLGADELKKSEPTVLDILGKKGDPLNAPGRWLLRSYAQKLQHGQRDEDDEERYKGTAIEPYMELIRTSEAEAEYWAR